VRGAEGEVEGAGEAVRAFAPRDGPLSGLVIEQRASAFAKRLRVRRADAEGAGGARGGGGGELVEYDAVGGSGVGRIRIAWLRCACQLACGAPWRRVRIGDGDVDECGARVVRRVGAGGESARRCLEALVVGEDGLSAAACADHVVLGVDLLGQLRRGESRGRWSVEEGQP